MAVEMEMEIERKTKRLAMMVMMMMMMMMKGGRMVKSLKSVSDGIFFSFVKFFSVRWRQVDDRLKIEGGVSVQEGVTQNVVGVSFNPNK